MFAKKLFQVGPQKGHNLHQGIKLACCSYNTQHIGLPFEMRAQQEI